VQTESAVQTHFMKFIKDYYINLIVE